MKSAVERLFGSMWSGLATGAVVGLAVVLPVATSAATTVNLATSTQAANVTAGDTAYKGSVSATYNQVVKIQAYYRNTSTGDDAGNLRLKISLPDKAGAKQVVTTTVSADNAKAVTSTATMQLGQENSLLQYIPGTAVWKHNTGSVAQPNIVETKLSDAIVGGQGTVLEPATKPGDAFGGTVSIQARVLAPGVNVLLESQVKGETNKWSTNNTAKPADTLRYIINYQNTANMQQKQVVARVALPAGVALTPGSTTLYSSSNSGGVKLASDAIAANGVAIGNYGPGANAYVTFEATIAADKLVCGSNELRAAGSMKPQDMSEYFSAAVTTVKRECAASPNAAPAPTGQPPAAASCDQLTLTKGTHRTLTAKVDYAAKNGAALKLIRYDFGDGSEPLTTDKAIVQYAYQKDGTYTVTATPTVTINGKDQPIISAACSKQVVFAASVSPAPIMKGNDLPNSGPGDVTGVVIGASLAGYAVHRRVMRRHYMHR